MEGNSSKNMYVVQMNKISMSSWLMEIKRMKRTGVAKKRCLLPKFNNIFREKT